eukprot:4170166-Pyramimonas_sp.AAC.1
MASKVVGRAPAAAGAFRLRRSTRLRCTGGNTSSMSPFMRGRRAYTAARTAPKAASARVLTAAAGMASRPPSGLGIRIGVPVRVWGAAKRSVLERMV